MTLLTVLDIGVAILLLTTIGFCVVLNRRLAALRRNEGELARVLTQFNEAAARAESGVARLKEASSESAVTLRERIEEARALCDDLAFLTQRGDKIAVELNAKLARTPWPQATPRAAPQAASRRVAVRAASAPAPVQQALFKGEPLSKAERDLIAALEAAR
jgi:Domain of unknown function (DUF6468)